MAMTPRNDQPAVPALKRSPPRWPVLALAVFACILPVALICAPPRWDKSDSGARKLPAGIGYKAAVDQLAAAGLLAVREIPRPSRPALTQIVLVTKPLQQNPRLIGDCRTRWERSAWSPYYTSDSARDCLRRLDEFVRVSTYLAQDMRQPAQWDLDDGKVIALKSNAHILLPAGDRRAVWRGHIRYRDEDVAGQPGTVSPARATLMLTEVGTARTLFRFIDGQQPVLVTLDAVLSGSAHANEGGSMAIAIGRPAANRSLFGPARITLQRLGRAVLIGIPPDLAGASFSIDGQPRGQDSSDFDNIRYWLIRSGQYLQLEDSSKRRVTVQLVETPASISELSGGRRIREPSLSDVSQSLEVSGVNGDIVSTIVGALQLDLQKRLAANMQTGAAPVQSYRGTALLMDGLTGEIAAAATYPTTPEQLKESDRANPLRTVWLSTNFNFQPLPVGSSAKIPFAAAITQRYPDLLEMRIPFHNSFDSIDGYPLVQPNGERKTIVNHRGREGTDPVDFNTFIMNSNNEYAMTLMHRATRREIGSHWKSQSSWAANLWSLDCVIPFGLTPGKRDLGWQGVSDTCSPYLWRGDGDDAIGAHPAAGDWLNLKMGSMTNDFADFYLDVIGGGRSSWTAANLSQAYARVISGRAVAPNLHPVTVPALRNSVAISLRTWTKISHGMSDVLRAGTAETLWRNVNRRVDPLPAGAFFYAKTGTSTLSAPYVGDGHILVLLAARTRSGLAPQKPADICALKILTINLQRDASSALAMAEEMLAAPQGRDYLRWMTQPCPANQSF